MSANPAQDLTPLTWVKGEIDLELALTRQYVEQFAFNPADASQLKFAHNHLHQVSGVLSMVGLAGVHRFCLEVEELLAALEAQKVAATAQHGELVKRALAAVSQYLAALLEGEPDVPVRLFPLFKEVAAAHGAGVLTEVELFYPDLAHVPAAAPEPSAAGDAEAVAKAERLRFQKSLVLWFRNSADSASLLEMAGAVDSVGKVPLPDAQRAFWWVAGAFLDALVAQGIPLDLPTRQLGAKIEQELRRLAEGAAEPTERTMRDLLYQVARAPREISERVRDVQLAYNLRRLLPSQKEQAETRAREQMRQPVLDKLRELVGPAKEDWNRVTSGSPQLLGALIEKAGQIKRLATTLEFRPLEKLANVIGGAAGEARGSPGRLTETLGIEMATAFLLLEHGVNDFSKLPAEFADQVNAVVARVRAAALGRFDEAKLPPAPQLDEVARRAQEKEVLGQVAHEITANLKQAEEIIDAFFRDHSKRAPLAQVEPILKQVEGALALLGRANASELLRQCQALVTRFAAPEYAVQDAETLLLADGLSGLGLFVHDLDQGAANEQTINAVLERFGVTVEAAPAPVVPAAAELAAEAELPVAELPAEVVAPAAPPPAPPAEAPVRDTPSDADLLAIFLEEAREVLGNIEQGARSCVTKPGDRDALTVVRRAFHTLKGSGRMVGLTQLGEVAWALEQVMNKWLEQSKAATPPLLDLVARARAKFSDWLDDLERHGYADVAGAALIADATELRTGERPVPAAVAPPPAPPAPPPAEAPVVEEVIEVTAPPLPEAVAAEEEVTIGSIVIPAELFQIFIHEASGHMAVLERERAGLGESLAKGVSPEFARSAHTLAGIGRTAGLPFIGGLASALEARAKAHEGGLHADAAAATLVNDGVVLLGGLLAEVVARRMPADAEVQRAAQLETQLRPPRERRAIRDDLDPSLLPIFLEEAQELIPMVGSELRGWRANPADAEASRLLKRSLHTLKGSARMAGAMRLGELTHAMESKVEAALEAGVADAEMFDKLEAEFDRLCTQIEHLGKEVVPEAAVEAAAAAPAAPALAAAVEAAAAPAAPLPVPAEAEAAAQPMLRVRAEMVDRLVNEAGEVAIARSRIEAELHGMKLSLRELMENLARLRNQLRELEMQAEGQMQSRVSILGEEKQAFDPLEFDRFTRLQELTRGMAESVNDLGSLQQNLQRNVDESDKALVSQGRTAKELQQNLLRVRAVAIGSYSERFYRTVRQSARDLGKKAALEIQGAQVELDRSVMQRVISPIEHMLRNSVAHGIEAPATRQAAGKPETGQIRLTIKQQGNEIAITLADDGAGLDLGRIRAKAVERGLARPDQEYSDAQVMQFIFAPGFSTAQEVSEVSGRGVGMDVVQGEITALGGRVEVSSQPGAGTTFTLYLPVTLAVAQVVMVKAGGQTYAVPSTMIEHLQEYKPPEITEIYNRGEVELRGQHYPFHYLARVLGRGDAAAEIKRYNTVLFLRWGVQRIAVHVDETTTNQEAVVKKIGTQLGSVPGIEGATVLGDGSIVLIVNPVQFALREDLLQAAPAPAPVALAPAPERPLVMVVDDSLTVRKITSRLLERAGYEPLTAKDGVEALDLLGEQMPAVMLVDIEMPRMDGFELTRAVRSDPRTKGVPIIMITSRTAEKHRNYAAELGVNLYLGKPYQEEELLAHIANFVKEQASRGSH